MGLIMSDCGGRAKTSCMDGNVIITKDGLSITLTMNDFCEVALYAITNTDLVADDPRTHLMDRISELELTGGYNPNGARYAATDQKDS